MITSTIIDFSFLSTVYFGLRALLVPLFHLISLLFHLVSDRSRDFEKKRIKSKLHKLMIKSLFLKIELPGHDF